MSISLKRKIQGQAYRLVLTQAAGVCVLAILVGLFYGSHDGLSVLAGGFAYVIPNILFVWRVFNRVSASEMTYFMALFFFGETMKLFFSAILFLVIVKYLAVSLLSTLVGFVAAIISFWIACMWHFSGQQK